MIVAAALLDPATFMIATLPRPARHHTIMHALVNRGVNPISWEQGFLTSNGRFVTRNVAEQVARLTGQLTKPLIGSILTSEDLW
jgi:hypothetical protein